MRLFDEIRTGLPLGLVATYVPPSNWAAFADRFANALNPDNVAFISADNVDDFFYHQLHPEVLARDETEKETPILQPLTLAEEYPGVIPPFPQLWIEWNPSSSLWRRIAKRFAVFVNTVRSSTDGFTLEIIGLVRPHITHGAIMSGRAWHVECDARGSIVKCAGVLLDLDQMKELDDDVSALWLHIPLLTLTLLNCRNVHLDWIPTPARLYRSFEKRHGKPPIRRYGTIVITPMTRLIGNAIADEPGASGTRRRQIAANKCRAHLKTYTDHGKLFGKWTGTFLWNFQERNQNASHGTINTYQLNTKGVTVTVKGATTNGS